MNEEAIAWLKENWDWNRHGPRSTFFDETPSMHRDGLVDPSEDPCGRGEITPEQWDRLERQQRGETG